MALGAEMLWLVCHGTNLRKESKFIRVHQTPGYQLQANFPTSCHFVDLCSCLTGDAAITSVEARPAGRSAGPKSFSGGGEMLGWWGQ